MKSHLILFSLLLILFSGCSKDDDSPKPEEEEVIPADEKFLSSINDDGFKLEYNGEKNIERINFSNQFLLIYGYEGNQINSLDLFSGNEAENYLITYDANGRINSFAQDDVVTPVIYNAVNKYYLYQKENGDEVSLFMDENENIKKIMFYDAIDDETQEITILYEESIYKGTLTNTNDAILPVILVIPEFSNFLLIYNLSKQPVRTVISPVYGIIDFENTFDEQNFLKTSTYTLEETGTFNFNYIRL